MNEAVSADMKRRVRKTLFGFACYQAIDPIPARGKADVRYQHVGLVHAAADVQRFLEGKTSLNLIKIKFK